MADINSAAWAKAQLLHYGISLTETAKAELRSGNYLGKRRVYSNYDDDCFLDVEVPPELFFTDSRFPATAIYKEDSPWTVCFENGHFFMKSESFPDYYKEILFLKKPAFYGKQLSNGEYAESYVTKLFGHSLGVFASTNCYFAEIGQACKFCSIKSNQGRPNDACKRVNKLMLLEAIEMAVNHDKDIDDIFISGGVISSDFDLNFLWYCEIAKAIKEKLAQMGKHIDVTLNTYPPANLDLAENLRGSDIAVMLSIETIDDELRKKICPGKSVLFNSLGMDNIFKRFVDVVGYGRVLAFVIEGIEDENTILRGVSYYGAMGVCIVVHVLHVDPGTWIAEQNMKSPKPEIILETAEAVSVIYHDNALDTSILYGGRSSLDAESSGVMFKTNER